MSNYTTAHNSYISILAELGLAGLVGFLMIQVSIIQMSFSLYRNGRRLTDRWRGAAIVALMVSYSVSSLFEILTFHPTVAQVYVYVFIGAIAGLYRSLGSVPALAPSRAHRRRFTGGMSTLRWPTNPASRF
jgi:O-antigen ligase